jgi:hypothetical protein
MADPAYLSLPLRYPTDAERAVLNKVLSFDFEGAEELRAELEGLQVRASCACGCPSIALFHPEGHHAFSPADRSRMAPLDLTITAGPGLDDHGGGMIVWLVEGHLADLEVYWHGETQSEVPPPDRIVAASPMR